MSTISTATPEIRGGTTTSWIPLTTAFPSQSGCADALVWYAGAIYPNGWDPGYGYNVPAVVNCLPPEVTQWWKQSQLDQRGSHPGTTFSIQPIVCPAAFFTAAVEARTSSSTFVKCCPSGYTLSSGTPAVSGACYTYLSSGQVITYTSVALSAPSGWQVYTVEGNSVPMFGMSVEGYNVGDVVLPTPTSSSSSTSRSSQSSHPTGISTSTPTSSSSPSNDLPTGSIAGIVVGVIIGIAIICIAAFLLFRKRRSVQNNPVRATKAELQAEAKTKAYQEMWMRPAELDTRPPELEARTLRS